MLVASSSRSYLLAILRNARSLAPRRIIAALTAGFQMLGAMLLGLTSLIQSGCGPGRVVEPGSFALAHDSIRWIYRSGWQYVYFDPKYHPRPPTPFSNAIGDVEFQDDRIVAYEHGRGDFGSGLYYPVMTLDLETGSIISTAYAKSYARIPPINLQRTTPGEITQITDGCFLRWTNDSPLKVEICADDACLDSVAIVELKTAVGYVGGHLFSPEQNCLLVVAYEGKPLSLGDATHYLVCIDLTRVPLDGIEPRVDESIR